ncbi:MAG TPA: quinone oxidoreductase [Bryobacteraceae bacterium]|nr:quinone oxidoreductase [Bryobacteraceae bacterium]
MKAIRVQQPGGPEALRLEDIDVPQPEPGHVLVRVAAAGVNFIDIYHRTGLYPVPAPFTLGLEGAGTVEAVGSGVDHIKSGDRVTWCLGSGPRSYAEFASIPIKAAIPVPVSMDLKLAAASMLQGMTAHYLAHSTYPLKPGDICLIHAAAGGTGMLLVQMAKMIGAQVIGTTSTEEKASRARRAGCDEVILYTQSDFEVEVKRLTDNRGVDVVYDSVGKTTFEKSLNCLRPRGTMVTFGNASGPVDPVSPLALTQRGSLFLTRPKLADYVAGEDELRWRAGDVLGWAAAGRLKVTIDREYPLGEAATAQQDLAERRTSGKLLLIP